MDFIDWIKDSDEEEVRLVHVARYKPLTGSCSQRATEDIVLLVRHIYRGMALARLKTRVLSGAE